MWRHKGSTKFLESVSPPEAFPQPGLSVSGDLLIQDDSDMSRREWVPKLKASQRQHLK